MLSPLCHPCMPNKWVEHGTGIMEVIVSNSVLDSDDLFQLFFCPFPTTRLSAFRQDHQKLHLKYYVWLSMIMSISTPELFSRRRVRKGLGNSMWENMLVRGLIGTNLVFEPYSACSLLKAPARMHQLEMLLIVLHKNK